MKFCENRIIKKLMWEKKADPPTGANIRTCKCAHASPQHRPHFLRGLLFLHSVKGMLSMQPIRNTKSRPLDYGNYALKPVQLRGKYRPSCVHKHVIKACIGPKQFTHQIYFITLSACSDVTYVFQTLN